MQGSALCAEAKSIIVVEPVAKRQSINARAKKVERVVQQFLWEGTKFAGNAKRPALEDEDLRGWDREGYPVYGECKNYSCEAIGKRGAWVILAEAYQQCQDAIDRNEHDWPKIPSIWGNPAGISPTPLTAVRPWAFSVLWPVGSSKDEQRLVMWEYSGEMVIVPLVMFKIIAIDPPSSPADL